MLDRHLDRLFRSADLIGLAVPWGREQVRQWVTDTLAANKDREEKSIKIIISGGVSDSLVPGGIPTIAIVVDSQHPLPAEWYEKGVGAITVKHHRYSPEAKTNNYIEAVKQIQVAKRKDAIEPIYYDETQVFEGSNSNVFAVIAGELLTPRSNVLSGITRNVLLEILKLDIPVKTKDFTIEQLLSAEEAFFAGSAKEILPITKIDGRPVGTGVVGKITEEVMQQFKNFTRSDRW